MVIANGMSMQLGYPYFARGTDMEEVFSSLIKVARDIGRVVDSRHILYIRATPSIALISADGVLLRWI